MTNSPPDNDCDWTDRAPKTAGRLMLTLALLWWVPVIAAIVIVILWLV